MEAKPYTEIEKEDYEKILKELLEIGGRVESLIEAKERPMIELQRAKDREGEARRTKELLSYGK